MARTSDPHAATVKAWATRARRAPESEGLGSYSPDGKWIPNDSEAMRKWGDGAVKPGDVPVPFPVWTATERAFHAGETDWWEGKRKIDADAPTPNAVRVGDGPVMVDVADLIATQHVVTESSVIKNVTRAKNNEESPYGLPVIVRVGDKMFIYDGHHRCSAAKIFGLGKVRAHLFEVSAGEAGIGTRLTNAKF